MDFNNPEDQIGVDGFGEAGSAKKRIVILAVLIAILLVIILAVIVTTRIFFADSDRPTNLIVMVADGFGPAHLTLARLASKHGKLALDKILLGHVSTASHDTLVTDSAAAATAYACGIKTNNTFVAAGPNGKACATLLEGAKFAKMKTGLVVTSTITHATPAAFASHSISRDDDAFIGRQMLAKGIDVIFGGGMDVLKSHDMFDWASSQYAGNVITTKKDLEKDLNTPVLGIFANGHLNYSIDNSTTQPSLAEMTEKAIDLLTNKKGFFLMIEGSRIDHASHANDVAATVQDILAFDAAVEHVLEFAESEENTLVVIVADHDTGGLSIGRDGEYKYDLTALKGIHRSIEFIMEQLKKDSITSASTVNAVKQYTSIFQAGDETYFANVNNASSAEAALINYFSRKTLTGWTTRAHTGVDTVLFGSGMGVTNFIGGVRSNAEVGATMARVMHFKLDKLTQDLASFTTQPQSKRDTATSIDEYHHFN